MSKVVANNKLPDKSVNRLPYGMFTLRLQNNSSVQDICLYMCLAAYRVIFNLFEAINLRSDMTVYPNMAKQFPLQRYLLIYMSLLSALSCN